MPKITTKPKTKDRPPAYAELYQVVPYTAEMDERQREVELLLNLQHCACGHDRTVHGDFLGRGPAQVMVVDCPHAGRCMVRGCDCSGFVFSEESSWEGKKKREKEMKVSDVYPPSENDL